MGSASKTGKWDFGWNRPQTTILLGAHKSQLGANDRITAIELVADRDAIARSVIER